MSSQDTETTPKHKSMPLAAEELIWLQSFAKQFITRELAAKALGLKSRITLNNVLRGGTGRYDTIALIRSKMKEVTSASLD